MLCLARSAVLLFALAWASLAQATSTLSVFECRAVEVKLEDARERQTAEYVAKIMCRVAPELAGHFGVELDGQPVELIMTEDMRSFADKTQRSFFTAAVHHNGRIITPPAGKLRESVNLEGIIKHELVHLMVYRLVGNRCPVWLNEGLAQHFEGVKLSDAGPKDEHELNVIEQSWRSRNTSVLQRRKAYAASLGVTRRLIDAVGQEALLKALVGLNDRPDAMELKIEGKAVRLWLFGPGAVPAREVQIQRGPSDPARSRRPPAADGDDEKVTPLPLDEMLKRAKEK